MRELSGMSEGCSSSLTRSDSWITFSHFLRTLMAGEESTDMKARMLRILPLILVLLYILSPYDVVPDFLFGPGWLDDLLLVGALIWFLMARRPGESPGDLFRRYRGSKRGSSGQGEGRHEERRERDAQDGGEEGDPFSILGIEPSASPDEIKGAYRRAVAKYHPDKVMHLGKEFQELAHKKLVAIQRAYETLMRR
jgi:uncharacterized membrane protein YkvA (DUF1232 family)